MRTSRLALALRLLVLSLMVSLNYAAILILPHDLMVMILAELVPVASVLNLVGTLVVGSLLDRERRAVERERALNEQMMTDPLTGIANRRGFQRMVEDLPQRRGRPEGSALLVIDVDHFKAINDVHGHDAGDAILAQLGARLKRCLRASDIVARFGGEEFVVMLPVTSADAAVAAAERVCRKIAEEPFLIAGRAIRVSISIGAYWEADIAECSSAIASADRALYAAKANGRNQVMFHHWLNASAQQPALAA